VFATKKLGLGLTKFGKRIKEDLVGAPTGSAAATLAYNTGGSRGGGGFDDDDEESSHRRAGGGGATGGGGASGSAGASARHARDLPPEIDGLREMIDAFVAGSDYWLAMQSALQQLVEAQAAVAEAQSRVGELLSADRVSAATSEHSECLAPGAFGSAHAKAAAARAAAAREMRLRVLEPLDSHVSAACVDASVAVKEYESALDDVALQHAHVQKLAAKGARKAGEHAAATAKLEQMRQRMEPQAQRVASKLRLLLSKQDLDAEKWAAKHASCERKLAQDLATAFTATVPFEQRAKGLPPPPPAVEPQRDADEDARGTSTKRGWLFGSSDGKSAGSERSKRTSATDASTSKTGGKRGASAAENDDDDDDDDDVGAAAQQQRGSSRTTNATSSRTDTSSTMRRTTSEPVAAVPESNKSARGRLGLGGLASSAAPATTSNRSKAPPPVVDDDDGDDEAAAAAAEAAAKAARKAARKLEKERAAASSSRGDEGALSRGKSTSTSKSKAAAADPAPSASAFDDGDGAAVSVFKKKKPKELEIEPAPPPPAAEKSKKRAW